MGTVFDSALGKVVASSYQLQAAPTFINDVVITREAAYFTDSQDRSSIAWRSDRLVSLRRTQPQILLPGTCRTNGIVATSDGEHLFVVDGATAQLYRLDTATHTAIHVDLGGDTLPNADGLLLDGKTLYVVQNFRNRIAVLELSPDYLSGTIVRFITEPFTSNALTKVPTTIAEFGNSIYAVTAGSKRLARFRRGA